MEIVVERVFTKEVLSQACSLFDVTIAQEKPLGDFENYIFKVVDIRGTFAVLRLTHSSHRSKDQILAEISFVGYLFSKKAHVAGPLLSKKKRYVEEVGAEDGTKFFCCLFTFAEGELIAGKEEFAELTFYEQWGRSVGQLHRLTMDYPHDANRETWEQDETRIISQLNDPEINEIAAMLIKEIKTLPETKETFGLIHGDIHPGNFHYNGIKITVFDFDDATYNYFVHDLAMVLYYCSGVYAKRPAIFQALLKGYNSEHALRDHWLKAIPLFMRLRDIGLYATLKKKFHGKLMPKHLYSLSNELHERIMHQEPP